MANSLHTPVTRWDLWCFDFRCDMLRLRAGDDGSFLAAIAIFEWFFALFGRQRLR
jgi:hypothetical protein